MEKINFCEGVVAQMMENEAWHDLSGDINWNETQLEKYADKLDWDMVCSNREMFWTISMIEKFKNRINWKALSANYDRKSISLAVLEKYADKWDWSEISESRDLPMEVVEKFADRLNWSKVIENWHFCDEYASEDFVRKFQERIPSGQFHNSNLWSSLVAKKKDELRNMVSID